MHCGLGAEETLEDSSAKLESCHAVIALSRKAM